jgi:Tol biopolymer transport system component
MGERAGRRGEWEIASACPPTQAKPKGAHGMKAIRTLIAFAAPLVMLAAALWPATPASATFLGADGWILYDGAGPGAGYAAREIFLTNSNGGNRVQLTHNSVFDGIPVVGPGRHRVAWVRGGTQFRTDQYDIMVAVLSGDPPVLDEANATNLTNCWDPDRNDYNETWNPGGTKLAFTVGNVDQPYHYQTYTMNNGTTCTSNGVTNISNNAFDDQFPEWSPDGSKFIFTSDQLGDNNDAIWMSNADGSGRQLVFDSAGEDRYPTWSPDGNLVAFQSDVNGPVGSDDLFVTDVSACVTGGPNPTTPCGEDPVTGVSGAKQITSGSADDHHAVWSPDGSQILYESSQGGDQLWKSFIDGSGAVQVTGGGGLHSHPDWGPILCTITGTNGNDTLNGTAGDDIICGLGGNDTINGVGGADTLLGGTGNDTLNGGTGNDVLVGGPGADSLNGGVDADRITSLDLIAGNDTIDGGNQKDTCTGDPGDVITNCP